MENHNSPELMTELFEGEELDKLRQATLAGGLAELRRRRSRRRVIRVCAVVGLLLAAGAVSLHTLREADKLDQSSLVSSGSPATNKTTVKTITDEELFALFPGRPMALVGTPGKQQLVFLDQSQPKEALTQ